MNASTTVLAIDPGYDRVGWVVGVKNHRQPQIVDLGLIQTDKQASFFERYQQIMRQLSAIIQQYQPSEVAIEELYFSKNTKTAMRVSEARGIILATCLKTELSVFEYGPTTIKQVATGNGRADKRAVAKMMRLQLKLDETIIDDTLDAAACYLTHVILSRK